MTDKKSFLTSKIGAFKAFLQYLPSARWVSWPAYQLSRLSLGKATQWAIGRFIRLFKVDMSIAQPADIAAYSTFNDFFTRAVNLDMRPLGDGVVSPVDGVVSQAGLAQGGRLIQAKDHVFTLLELFGGHVRLAKLFEQCAYCVLYLSPGGYHRVHMPVRGKPVDMIYVPGRLFSVNQKAVDTIPNLYARNERVISFFKSEAGPMAIVMVGATFVGSIETVWQGQITPSDAKSPEYWRTPETTPTLAHGEEMGRFNMGSTVIVLFQHDRAQWSPTIQPGAVVKVRETIGSALTSHHAK